MDNMSPAVKDIVIKQEPVDDITPPSIEENNNNSSSGGSNGSMGVAKDDTHSAEAEQLTPASQAAGPLRYVSRRGRPPGGGYSMKPSQSPYVSFGQSSTGIGSHEFLRQSSLGTPSGSPQDLLKSGLDSSLDSLDARRFGLHCFEGEKNSFRCDGCDVVFGSRDTYAMHMLLRAKNESCVALPTAAISANPENPTPREKFERELREKAMINAIRSQAALMSKAAVAAAAAMPRSSSLVDSAIPTLPRSPNSSKEDLSHLSTPDLTSGLGSLFAFDSYGLYMDQRQYRRLLTEYGFRAASSSSALSAMMEQLSCSVCGEVFANKDALAMHMMFHTREEESESKPVIPTWKLDPSSALGKMLPLSVNTDTQPSRGRTYHESSRKQESSRSGGDKQLTAERIAELKRMAIESSLKSSLKKHSNSHERCPRPKSVSEDTVVTSSAQTTRPLSADDAFKMSHSSEKGVYKPHKTMFRSRQREDDYLDDEEDKTDADSDGKRRDSNDSSNYFPHRKRTLSISDDYLSRYSSFYKRQKYVYSSNDIHGIGFRYNRMKSPGGESLFPKLRDNHVSSASGPQDSDETSNGSPTSAPETNPTDDIRSGETHKHAHEVASSSLDNLMSNDTVLVPVENLEDVQINGVHADLPREMLDREMDDSDRQAAIDFSVGKQRGSDNEDSCSTDSSSLPSKPRLGHPRKSSDLVKLSPRDLTDDSSSRRSLTHQHRVELMSDGTQATVAKESHHSDGQRSNDVTNESSRVGEARYCVHCEILFLDVTLFHLHMGLHNVNNPWQCNICGLVCAGRLEFNTHVLHY